MPCQTDAFAAMPHHGLCGSDGTSACSSPAPFFEPIGFTLKKWGNRKTSKVQIRHRFSAQKMAFRSGSQIGEDERYVMLKLGNMFFYSSNGRCWIAASLFGMYKIVS